MIFLRRHNIQRTGTGALEPRIDEAAADAAHAMADGLCCVAGSSDSIVKQPSAPEGSPSGIIIIFIIESQ
jgi:hypothetical protein